MTVTMGRCGIVARPADAVGGVENVSVTHARDLLIVARERLAFYDVLQRSAPPTLEVRLDQRGGNHEVPTSVGASDRRERRVLDVSAQLRTVGWAMVLAADRP
jgi:hypothetical protein